LPSAIADKETKSLLSKENILTLAYEVAV